MFVEDAFHRFRKRHSSGSNDDSSSNSGSLVVDPFEFPSPIVPKIFYFMLFYCFGGYRPFVPLFLKSIGFSDSLVGMTLFFPPSLSFLAGPIWSGICDRFKCHRRAVVFCSIISAFLILLLYLIDNHPLVIIIVIVNSVVWAPLTPILDSTTYKILGKSSFLYGKQRMFGSIGFAISATLVGFLANLLGKPVYWINYPIMIFAYGLMVEYMYYDQPLDANSFTKLEDETACSLSGGNEETTPLPEDDSKTSVDLTGRMEVTPITSDDDDTEEIDIEDLNEKNSKDDQAKQMTFGQSLVVLLSNYRLLCFLLNALIVGTGMAMNNNFLGIIITEHLNGTTTLVGVGSVLNIVFELVFFFFGKQILDKLGTMKMIIVSHVALILRVLAYIVIIKGEMNAWSILPVELLHGIIFASIWSAGSRICSDLAPKGLEATSQSLLYSVYLGLGMGIGALVAGRILETSGPVAMYLTILLMTIFGLLLFIAFQIMERHIESKKLLQQQLLDSDSVELVNSNNKQQPAISTSLDNHSLSNEKEAQSHHNDPKMILRASFE
ncbi:hypothetical protein PPL_10613 [Heterostelium album PN500]|uniref:Major facilitator superfamily associated domain-containing protein n=1 Tax=Heterostelium pallidum (strain ATCC 26659 / Pp 5 / PN500) TaxID=670386 RepID=D3BRK2_HETP5|nr:hypothetical protein PPL_10613 [Heterostelium album PN500]EFA76034.1 hypothetical protein PPL_10613 [Heterostelium album PN500]|eukprot:XP_020428168.1 hypothetical protein PPL_10613 [Heterostelium album PN500]